MNDKQQIRADARKFGAQFGGFMKLAELMGQAGDAEQFAQEAQQRLDKIKAEEAAILNQRGDDRIKMESEIADLRKAAQAEIAQKTQDAGALLVDAKARAESIVAAAQESAAAMLSSATAEAQGIVHAVDVQRAKLETLSADIATKQSELSDLSATVTEKTAQLASITQQLADLKAKF